MRPRRLLPPMENLGFATLNIWNDRERPRRRLEVIAEGLRALEPDLVALQEVRESDSLRQASLLAELLSMDAAFGVVDPDSPGGPIGNAVLSRFPIEKTENVPLPSAPDDPRYALKVQTATPAGPVWMFSCHLSWEPHQAPRRERQVLALAEAAQAPEGVTVLLGGDFNCAPEARAIRFLCGHDSLEGQGTFFRDVWARRHAHEDGFTWSSRNPFAVRWIEQNRRIDYLFVGGPVTHHGERTVEEARLVLDYPAHDGTWPSDHFGVFAKVRLAPRPAAPF